MVQVGNRHPRICRVATYPRFGREGMGRASYELAERLRYPTLYITKRFGERPLPHGPHIILKEVLLGDEVLPERFRNGPHKLWHLVRKACLYILFFIKSAPVMIKFKPSIVHIHSMLPLLHALFAKSFLRSRIFVTFHGTDLYRIRHKPSLALILRCFDHVFYVSRAMEEVLREVVPKDKLSYTPNGIELERFEVGAERRGATILSAGVFKWQKGLDLLLEAFSEFLVSHPNYKLRIAGSGPLESKLKELSSRLGIDESIEWLGRLSQGDLIEEYRKAKIFVLPSVSEGFPKVVLEAMACATPVICSDVGSCSEIVADAGIVVSPRSRRTLVEAMEKIADDKELWVTLSKRSRNRAEKFPWDRAVEAVAVVITDLLGHNTRVFPELVKKCPRKGSD